jgi:hypothetical protein
MRFLAVIYQYTLAKPFLEKLSILLSGLPEPEELSNLNSMANTCASLPFILSKAVWGQFKLSGNIGDDRLRNLLPGTWKSGF